ncbi:MAG: AAA family ATPase [Spirochaetia bacterium]|nr:AAA family ATPase [Spirochaetia bacterium]
MSVVRIAGIDVPVSDRNGEWLPDTSLVLTPTTIRNLQKILHPLRAGIPILLVGDAGVGKNALVYYINALRRHPTIRYSFNEDTLPEDMVGAYRVDPMHSFIWSDGPLTRAIRTGAVFVADEMNLAPPEVLKRFLSVFAEANIQLLEGDSTTLQAADGFHFIATQNPAEGFEGRKNLPREIQKYFATIYVDPYPDDEIIQILAGTHPAVDAELIRAVVAINTKIENAILKREIGTRDLERYHFNLRNMNRLCFRLAAAPTAVARQRELYDIYVHPFRQAEDKKFVQELIHSVISDKHAETEVKIAVANDSMKVGHAVLIPGSGKTEKEAIDTALQSFPPVVSRLPFLASIGRAIEMRENILLESDADVEPEEYVEFFARLMGAKLTVIHLSKGMHTSDILGGLKPVRERELAWVDGPITRAVRNGDYLLIRGLEAAGPELVEKLNMLLDDAKALLLPPEAGEKDPLILKEKAVIFALKVFRNTKSTPTISRAFRNRFSSIIVPAITDSESLEEIVLVALGAGEEDAPMRELASRMVQFHLKIRTLAEKREIGSGNIQPYAYGLTNLHRWADLLSSTLAALETGKDLHESIVRSAGISYLNEISDPNEREKAYQILERLLASMPLDEVAADVSALKKKPLIKQNKFGKRIDWNPEDHFREANTGRAKRKVSGNDLKKGININTPETGGGTKEGQDAWYGEDTQGNRGQGPVGSGGGGWGYRTEELYQEFLKKRRALWEYNLGVSLKDFHEIFGPEIERVVIDFDRLLDPRSDIHRRYQSHGSRVDGRRYLAYISGKGDGRVFDKTTVTLERDRLKGVEIIFAMNKGRRIFNFEYSIATLVSILSSSIILSNHRVPVGVVGYSDLTNGKKDIDLSWFKNLEEEYTTQTEEHLFDGLSRDWHGDTISESEILIPLADSFSPAATTKIMVMLSDFRGARAKMKPEDTASSREGIDLKNTIEQLARRDIHFLGVGLGPKSLADYFFPEYLSVSGENYSNLPVLLSNKISEIIHRHHRS